MKSTPNTPNIILRPLRARKATIPLAALLLLSLAGTALAQGTAFTYQGRLNTNGAPASGNYDLTFALFNAASGGTQAGNTITNTAVGVANGLFTVMLDFGDQFSGTPYWLQIGVRTNGSGAFATLSPLQELTPAPYAVYAESASGLSGTVSASQLTSIGNTNTQATGNFFVGPSGNSTMNGWENTADGVGALLNNTLGPENTAYGYQALYSNTTGYENTANGYTALWSNTSGNYNTANGAVALQANTGSYNTANGARALLSNTSGNYNTANGISALVNSTNGSYNTASGSEALVYNTCGSYNIALGYKAGYNIMTGSSNIDIGNEGLSTDTNIIRIGSGQSQTFIAGVINGNGGGLTGLNASQLTGGTVPLAQLPAPLQLSANMSGSLISATNNGDTGVTGFGNNIGVVGIGDVGLSGQGNSYGVSSSGGDWGVYATTTSGLSGTAVFGSGGEYGVDGEAANPTAIGVYGRNSWGYTAGYFQGNVNVNGTLSKSGGSFKIDHPLDPANKYLSHSFVESPDMKNIYDGVTVLDGNGEAVVQLPDWFEALNRDFRYQLTAIGAPGPNLYIAQEVSGNQFKIAGGAAGNKVSWQVTGIRQDAYANTHRIPVEEAKPANERGLYLHPELFGQPAEKQVGPRPPKMPAPPKPSQPPAPGTAPAKASG